MHYIYILKSQTDLSQEYVGQTADLKLRLRKHNSGQVAHTSKFMPWKIIWYCAFEEKAKALAFEKYLKSASGRAFSKKRFTTS